MRKRIEYRWEILRLKASPAAFLGTVRAPDAESAIKRAIEEFQVEPCFHDRLMARKTNVQF